MTEVEENLAATNKISITSRGKQTLCDFLPCAREAPIVVAGFRDEIPNQTIHC